MSSLHCKRLLGDGNRRGQKHGKTSGKARPGRDLHVLYKGYGGFAVTSLHSIHVTVRFVLQELNIFLLLFTPISLPCFENNKNNSR